MTNAIKLPQELLDRWHLGDCDLLAAIRAGELGELTVSSILISYLKMLFYDGDNDDTREHEPPTLASLAIESMVRFLNSSEDLRNIAPEIFHSLEGNTFRELLMSSRIRYPVLRACIDAASDDLNKGDNLIDIDDAILANERYLRSRGVQNKDNAYLLTLEDLSKLLTIAPCEDGIGMLSRRKLPKGGLEVLNPPQDESVRLHTDSARFAISLKEETDKELRGLDWGNVLMASDIVLETLLVKRGTYEPGQNDHDDPKPLDLYLYGLNAQEANKKVGEIYDVWASNLTGPEQPRLVVKDGINISFVAHAHRRPIRIRSQLYASVTEALLNLEPCAIGFDGSRIVMLPRCARTLETGYIVLTTDYLWHCRYGDRLAKVHRLHQLVGLGFGLRVSASLVTSLAEEGEPVNAALEQTLLQMLEKPEGHEPFFARLFEPHRIARDWAPDSLAEAMDQGNQTLFGNLQEILCAKLQILFQTSGYTNYLTRRIRRHVHGPDLASIQEKQITIPMQIPAELETYFYDSILSEIDPTHQWLIPVHDPSKHDPQLARLPSLPDNFRERGNPRYWVLSNESMWAGQHSGFDQLSDVLWALHEWFILTGNSGRAGFASPHDMATPECLFGMVQRLRRQLGPHPYVSSADDDVRRKQGLPPLKDSLRFRALLLLDSTLDYDIKMLDNYFDESSDSYGWI